MTDKDNRKVIGLRADLNDKENFRVQCENDLKKIMAVDSTHLQFSLGFHGVNIDYLPEHAIKSIRDSLVMAINVQMENLKDEIAQIEKQIEYIKIPVADNMYNGAIEMCCPHCDHGTYVDTDDNLSTKDVFDCKHCGGKFKLSQEVIDTTLPKDTTDALASVREEISKLVYADGDCSELMDSFEKLFKVVTNG